MTNQISTLTRCSTRHSPMSVCYHTRNREPIQCGIANIRTAYIRTCTKEYKYQPHPMPASLRRKKLTSICRIYPKRQAGTPPLSLPCQPPAHDQKHQQPPTPKKSQTDARNTPEATSGHEPRLCHVAKHPRPNRNTFLYIMLSSRSLDRKLFYT